MKYALGNMLNGAGGLNPDGLALDLQFAADKTLTARKGPSPILTRGSTGTFVGSNGLIQTAAVNAARFDHDPVTLASRGLLIEEGRTNLLVQSENFGTTWVTTNTTISANTEIAPNGTTTADTATANNAGTNFLAQQVTVTASTQYTFSFYVKRGSATNATYSVYNNNANNDIVSTTSYFSQTSSSDWVRVSFQFTTPVGCTSIFVYVLRNTGSTGSMHFWGAQLEAGSFATSYIPTTTSALARSADVCSITGANFTGMWNATEGSTFFNGISVGRGSGTFGSAAFFLDIASSTVNRLSQYATGAGGIRPEFKTANIDQYAPTSSAYTNNTVARQSVGFRSGATSSGFFNNTAFSGGANIALTMPSVDGLYIGSSSISSNFCNGTISTIRYYKKRLSNQKLQALTA